VEVIDLDGVGDYGDDDEGDGGGGSAAARPVWGQRWDRSPRIVSRSSTGADEPRYTAKETGAARGHTLPYDVGSMVRHPQFGSGRIVALTPANNPTRAKIHFSSVGTKTLVLEYARLELIG